MGNLFTARVGNILTALLGNIFTVGVGKVLDIYTGVRFHDLRHTAASRMVEAGVDLVTVSKILGHSTIQMTMRYAHPTPENMRRAVETLAQNVPSAQDFVPVPSPKEESVPANALVSAN